MFELNNLAKYSKSQIEGELKQDKRLRAKYWLYVVIFVTFASVLTAIAIISTNLYCFYYLNNITMYLAITSGTCAVVFWILFFIYFALNMKEGKVIKILESYLKNNKKK
ncbi:MAG: hypothetical protein MJ214_00010 [Bacilli bacterium]|nr:hypothetical protein [Bacilli bacterium]